MFIFETVITEKCNLGCKYCYMNNNPINMDYKTFDLLFDNINKILNIYKQKIYHLDFFGGEPLINFDLIKYAVPKLKDDVRCKAFGIISNLLLLNEEKVRYIQDNNINVSFSFDGLWNEFNRPLVDGSSSLVEYEKKKDLIKQVSPYFCKAMVSPSSLGTIVENARYLAEVWGFTYIDFSLVRDNIWSKEDIEKFKKEIRDLSDLQIQYIKNNKDVVFGFYVLFLADMFAGKKYGKRPFGCFAGHRGLGYMPNGVLYPCARFGTKREYPIYDLNTDTLYEDNYKIFTNENNINPQKFEGCQKCKYYTYCNAGCTYSQMLNDFKPLVSICKLYDIIYQESLYVFENLKGNKLFIDKIKNILKG